MRCRAYLLTTGGHHEAGQVLATFAHYVSEGMIPNRFDDYSNEPTYNTVDASLWFIQASHAYLKVTKDRDTYDSVLRPACEEIVDGYTRGTRFKHRRRPGGRPRVGRRRDDAADVDGREVRGDRLHAAAREGGGDQRAVVQRARPPRPRRPRVGRAGEFCEDVLGG